MNGMLQMDEFWIFLINILNLDALGCLKLTQRRKDNIILNNLFFPLRLCISVSQRLFF
jgi:hypothetical protein